jgi:hypothetical protein
LHGILKNGTLAAMGIPVLKTPPANSKRTSMLYKVLSTCTRKFDVGLYVKVIHLPSFLPSFLGILSWKFIHWRKLHLHSSKNTRTVVAFKKNPCPVLFRPVSQIFFQFFDVALKMAINYMRF